VMTLPERGGSFPPVPIELECKPQLEFQNIRV